MCKTELIEKLICLPSEFEKLGNESICSLIESLGHSDEIEVNEIVLILKKQPHRVDEWINYSVNKRTSTGWYIRSCGENRFEVGCLDGKGTMGVPEYFEDPYLGCAKFIKFELDSLCKCHNEQSKG